MSRSASSPAQRLRNSEDKLYQACLDACIEGIENLAVSKRRRRSATVNTNNTAVTVTNPVTTNSPPPERAATPPTEHLSAVLLISPPLTPRQRGSSDAAMNRAPLHGAPIRGRGEPAPTSPHGYVPPHLRQDARDIQPAFATRNAHSNFAVEPAANSGSVKLKKAAVKIVGAASASPSRGPTPAASPSPVSGPVKAKAKEVERHEPAKPMFPVVAPTPVSTKSKPSVSDTKEESVHDLFARLTATTKELSLSSSSIKQESPARSGNNISSFDDRSSLSGTPVQVRNSCTVDLSATPVKPTESLSGNILVSGDITNVQQSEDISQSDIEQQYMEKAALYLQTLPSGGSVIVQIIKTVSAKLRSAYSPNSILSVDEAKKLKARYAFAIVNHVKKTSAKTITSESAKQILRDSDGNMLRVYAKLVDEEYILLTDLESIGKLSQVILDALPKAEPTNTSATATVEPTVEAKAKPVTTSSTTKSDSKPVSGDSIDSMQAWPTQEKRETPPAYRACILKGVSGVKNVNQLQALVWGGRLESIAMPAPGSDFAVVRFLTTGACDKYFKATENGIELQGDKKTVVFVEKQPGPASVNDVMEHCAAGDASRCVRALDAEEDMSEVMLMKLARGKGTTKREVDRIKQGKTTRGRHYIEFRFANIYHALNFKRQLHEDDDWEHCTISYAADPCETAEGVHYKDKDE